MKVPTLLLFSAGLLLAEPPKLQVVRSDDDLVLSWNSDSVKPGTPALHYDFQVQGSDDLEAWTDVGTKFTGGVGGTNSTLTFTQTISSAPKFFRLQYQVNLKDQNLGGIDLTDADLSFADLTNTDLSGTNLTGANLTRAILQGTNLNNANLDNTVFSPSSEGLYNLTQLTGGTLPVSMLPDLPSYAADGDFVGDIAGFQLIPTSQRTVIVQLAAGAMIDDLNTLLTANNGQVAGSIASTSMQTPLMAIRFNSDATTIKTIRSNLQASPHVISAVLDLEQQERILPGYEGRTRFTEKWLWNSRNIKDWNWGLEWARVPQAWNFNDSFEKLDLMRNGSAASKPPVFVVDSGFQRGHPEFHPRPNVIGPNPFTVNHMGHGTHVTGIVASQFTRGRDQNGFGKTEGVDPYCNLHLMTYSRPFSYFSQLKDISWLAYQQSARVINCSYGYSWSSTDASGTRTVISPDSRPEIQSEMNKWSFMAQVTFSGLDAAGKSPFVVIAAGNDAVDSQWAGAMERYSRIIGSNDIIIVGAQAANSTAFQTLSNTNVEIMAPGEFIGSTWPFSTHHALTGTSMAAPHVTGAASYLLHFNPNLTNTQLKFLLSKGNVVGPSSSATPTVLDLFGSMRLMDSVAAPPEMTVEQMLLDVDDGTPDGNLRLRYAPPPGFDPTMQPVPMLYEKEWTTEVTDPGGLAHPSTVILTRPGDGVIDMSDFRKMRDNIIYFEGSLNNTPHMLDDSPYSMKLDANHNGVVETGIFEDLYSRTDFNGNGGVSRSLTVNGLTDLDILMNSTLWADEYVTSTSVLPQLLDSGDLRIGLTEIIFEFTQDFDAIEIIVSGGGYNHTRQFNATFENGDIDPSILWNFHHQGLLVTLPVGTHTVRINVKRGRNGIPVAFETSVTVGLGEDTFYILQLFDAIQN